MKKTYPVASLITAGLATALDASQKFILPVGGRVFDGSISESMIETFHLPYDVCAFEFEMEGLTKEDKFHVVPVMHRIALCMGGRAFLEVMASSVGTTMQDVVRSIPDALPIDGLCVVWPIDKRPDGWFPSWVGMVVPYEQRPRKTTKEDVVQVRSLLREAGADDKIKTRPFLMDARPLYLGDLGEKTASAYRAEEARYAALVDTDQEVTATLQACSAMACANVSTDTIRPTREARACHPASTLYEYHVLMVDPDAGHEPGEGRGGTHASPRRHLRRGHIRRLPWRGATVFVSSCIVNKSATGVVEKDYAIHRSGRSV
jgi:hypothetical protein